LSLISIQQLHKFYFLREITCNLQEAVVNPPYVAFSIRPSPGFWEYVKVNSANLSVEGITVTDYLKFKEMIYDENWYAMHSSV